MCDLLKIFLSQGGQTPNFPCNAPNSNNVEQYIRSCMFKIRRL